MLTQRAYKMRKKDVFAYFVCRESPRCCGPNGEGQVFKFAQRVIESILHGEKYINRRADMILVVFKLSLSQSSNRGRRPKNWLRSSINQTFKVNSPLNISYLFGRAFERPQFVLTRIRDLSMINTLQCLRLAHCFVSVVPVTHYSP